MHAIIIPISTPLPKHIEPRPKMSHTIPPKASSDVIRLHDDDGGNDHDDDGDDEDEDGDGGDDGDDGQ